MTTAPLTPSANALMNLEKLIYAFITSRVGYWNGLLTGIIKKTTRQLAARPERCCQDSDKNLKIWTYNTSPHALTLASKYI